MTELDGRELGQRTMDRRDLNSFAFGDRPAMADEPAAPVLAERSGQSAAWQPKAR
jgi:hypothetical protein